MPVPRKRRRVRRATWRMGREKNWSGEVTIGSWNDAADPGGAWVAAADPMRENIYPSAARAGFVGRAGGQLLAVGAG